MILTCYESQVSHKYYLGILGNAKYLHIVWQHSLVPAFRLRQVLPRPEVDVWGPTVSRDWEQAISRRAKSLRVAVCFVCEIWVADPLQIDTCWRANTPFLFQSRSTSFSIPRMPALWCYSQRTDREQ